LSDIYCTSVPLAMIDFGGTLTIPAGQSLVLQWPTAGVFRFELA
jgi:hypothetical protein